MRWFNRYNFPYSNFHDLNLDWIIKEMTRVVEEWEQVKAEWEQMKIEWAEFQAEMQRLWEDYKALMNAAWEAYKAQINQEWADYKDEMDAAWDAYQAELNAQWLAYQNNLNAAWEAYRTSLNDSWSAYQTSMNAWKDGVDQDIQDKFDELDEKCRQCKAEVDAAIATLNGLLASVQQQVTDYLNNLPYQTIIHDTAIEWLDEHGVTVTTVFLTPEDFGAVGDGTTNDYTALNDLITQAKLQNKPISFGLNKTYYTSGTITVEDVTIYGNNATIKGASSVTTLRIKNSKIYNLNIVDGSGIFVLSNTIMKDISASSGLTIGETGTTVAENVIIENGTFDYNVIVQNARIVTLENIFNTNGYVIIRNSEDVVVDKIASTQSSSAILKGEIASGSYAISTCYVTVSNYGNKGQYIIAVNGATVKLASYTTV